MNSTPEQDAQVSEQARPASRFLHLLYHELSPEPGTYKYAMSTGAFEEQLQTFERVCSLPNTALRPEITFDDGHISHYTQALPLLRRSNLSAHFFITAGWTSHRPDYMNWAQLRELAGAGQTIGAHGWSHKLLTHCSTSELETELSGARQLLEDKLALPITTMSLPGGRYNRDVLEACTRAGYTQVFTSVPRAEASLSAALIGRLNLRSTASAIWLNDVLTSSGGALQRLQRQHRCKEAAQRALGDALYGKLWALLNRAEAQPA